MGSYIVCYRLSCHGNGDRRADEACLAAWGFVVWFELVCSPVSRLCGDNVAILEDPVPLNAFNFFQKIAHHISLQQRPSSPLGTSAAAEEREPSAAAAASRRRRRLGGRACRA